MIPVHRGYGPQRTHHGRPISTRPHDKFQLGSAVGACFHASASRLAHAELLALQCRQRLSTSSPAFRPVRRGCHRCGAEASLGLGTWNSKPLARIV